MMALAQAGSAAPARNEAQTAARLEFRMERSDVLSSYTLAVDEQGRGSYRVRYPAGPTMPAGETAELPVQLNAGTTSKLFEQMRGLGSLRGGCESKLKNVAKTGQKTLTLTGPDGAVQAGCTWNYSENRTVATLGEEFMAFSYTLDMGRTLEREQRFDRLGLDKDMALLADAVKSGRAQGVETIAPVLEKIAADLSLLERVRARAGRLLEQSQVSR